MEKYRQYKDSGLNWIGTIPSNWTLLRANYIFKLINERSKTGKETLLSVSETGIKLRSEANVTMFMAENYEGYKLCQPEDLVINSLWAWSNGLGFSDYSGIVSTAYSVFRIFRKDKANYKYLKYLLKTPMYVGQYNVLSKGIWKSRLTLSDWDFLRIPILLPPIDEQDAIAKYLDSATGEIDKAIAQQQKMIDLLNERKQIIINNAVTKGLDPNVPMKDSGIDWIGDIPKNWHTRKLKSLISFQNGYAFDSMNFKSASENGVSVIRIGDIADYIDEMKTLKVEDKKELSKYTVYKNDILIAMSGATTGKNCFVSQDIYAYINQRVGIVRTNNSIITKFIYYTLNTKGFANHIQILSNGSAQPNISDRLICVFQIPFPSLTEQNEIVSWLDKCMQSIDLSINNCQQKINAFKERKQIIINEAVTGKIKI